VFAREGFFIIGTVSVIALALVLLALRFGPVVQVIFIALALLAVAFTLWFFRDPLRSPPDDDDDRRLILSPADGKIVVVEDVEDRLYLKGPARTGVDFSLSAERTRESLAGRRRGRVR
jgi:phosphatidylserine decarboxylase